ncbi:efflux transporter [Artomyces pyxidatus]|uniref:Efflux transporter n=1 Tax=Artomyces pyxidatus TaxID=48021 RepID=A0ACB8SXK9_9AGAM|nr:efflux transporter [Artomyces pyxidatus]
MSTSSNQADINADGSTGIRSRRLSVASGTVYSDGPAIPSPTTSRSALASVCIVAACTSAMMMNIAFGPSIAISVPYAGKDLGIAQENLQWIISAYSISSGCLLVLCGRLADLYGRKKVWVVGYMFMAIFGLGSGFAQDEITLDVSRGIQGIGGAAVVPASLGILAHAFPPSRARSAAFATFAAGAPIGAIFGFVVGSVLTQLTKPTWRSPLYLFSGLCVLGVVLGVLCIDADEPSTEEDKRVDWIGAFLVTAGLVLIFFVLSDSPTAPRGWKTSYIIALLVIGVVLLAFFVAWQYFLEKWQLEGRPPTRWTAPPLMKLSMWRRANGRFAVMQTIACLNWAGFVCWIVWVQLYYQSFRHYSPILTMIRILPIFFVGVTANVIIALTIGRVDVVYIIAIGTLLTSAGNLLFAVIVPSAPYWAFGFPSAMIIVLGADFVFASGTLFIAKVCFPHEQSVAGALFQSMTQVGTAIGLSVSTIVFNSVLKSQSARLGVQVDKAGDNAPEHAQLKAYHAAQWTGVAFGIFCTALTIFLRGVGIVGHNDKHAAIPDAETHVFDEKTSQNIQDMSADEKADLKTSAPS